MDVFPEHMTPLKRALIEKAGHDHGFEHVLPSSSSVLNLGSARHPARVAVSLLPQGYAVALVQGPPEFDTKRDKLLIHIGRA
jgi:hypothetical protein